MKKYIRVLLLCLLMTLMLVPSTAFAAEEVANGECGNNLVWSLDREGTLTISGTGAMNDYIDDRAIPWFNDSDEIKHINIETGVTSIGNFAFCDLSSLTDVTIADSVTSIGDEAFQYCTKLGSITIPDNVTTIGDCAFWSCECLSSVTIGKHVASIGKGAFQKCTSLTDITIPASVTNFDYYVFWGCSSLKSVVFTGDAPALGYLMFNEVTATVSYPQCSGTWTDEVRKDYGGTLTWVANEHNEVIDTPEVPATCSKDGHEKVSHCSSCNIQISNGDVIPATGNHTEEIDVEAKAATCGTDGHEAVSHCSVCDKSLSRGKTIPATGKHTEEIDMEAKEATCGKDGHEAVSHCSVCDKSLSKGKTIPATGKHSPEAIVTKATLNADGEIAYKCSTCGTATQDSETIYMPKAFSLSYATTSYNGKAKTPYVTVKDSQGNVLEKDKDYSVAYASGCTKVGIYKVTVKGAGNYSFTKTLTLKINPATPALKKTTVRSKKLTVYMTTKPSSKGASTYQIYYKQKGTSKWKSITTTSASKTIKKLKKGKKYYVKVRAYKTVGSTKYYSCWSKTSTSKKVK